MMRPLTLLASSALLATGAFVVGCDQPAEVNEQSSGPAATAADADGESASDHDHHGHSHGQADEASVSDETQLEIEKWLAQLSVEDRKLAEEQKVCPVTGELLGSMGPGIKMQVGDQTVFVCCEGCKKPVEENPDKYLKDTASADAAP